MSSDDLGDWRINAASHITADVPAAYPGGPSHKAGTPLFQVTGTRDPQGRPCHFLTPSTVALFLNIAMKASLAANTLRGNLRFTAGISPDGTSRDVANEDTTALFDCFEQCMMAAIASFQALEGFANFVIGRELSDKQYTLQRRKGPETFSVDDLERVALTEEKLGVILPDLFKIASPKGKRVWGEFVDLKRIRDGTVHTKSADQYPHRRPTMNLDQSSIYYQFLYKDTTVYPKTSIAMIKYFYPTEQSPRWLTEALKFAANH